MVKYLGGGGSVWNDKEHVFVKFVIFGATGWSLYFQVYPVFCEQNKT